MSGPGYCGRYPSRPFATLLTPKLVARFWSKVDASGGPDACWVWTGPRWRTGYAQIWVVDRQVLVHRFAWALEHGDIPPGRQALHRCDNPACVNVRHLFLGTQADNMQDRSAKGRVRQGRRLTAEQVRDIRELREVGATLEAIGDLYGISASNVCQVVRRRTHRKVSPRISRLPSENGGAA